MIALSSACLAIALAAQSGTIRIEDREGRFGTFVVIADTCGTIEVADSISDAQARINAILERVRNA